MKLTPSGDSYFSLDRVLSWKEFAKNAKKADSDAFVEMSNIEDELDDPSSHELMIKPEHGQLALDIYQTAADLIVEAPIAGVNPQDLDISIQDDVLTLRGKRVRCNDIDSDDLIYQECHWGEFSRSIVLPMDVVSERIEATLKNGILTIRMPKAQPNRRINVRFEQ